MSVKISELPESQELFEGCCFPVVTNGETYKVTYGQIKEKLQEELQESDPTVPQHVKNITYADIERWNEGADVPTKLSQLEDDATHRLVTDTEKSTWNGKGTYSKPSGGIPKTDLASAVQTSLGKADSAVQPASISDMATKTWVNAQGFLTLATLPIWNGGVVDVN